MPLQRPICKECNKNYCAINYNRNGKTYYRRICDNCGKKKAKKKPIVPSWEKAGYKKKPHCEKCGFKAKYKEQLFVYYVDGNLNNNTQSNLRTICANCHFEVAREGLGWRQGDLVHDF